MTQGSGEQLIRVAEGETLYTQGEESDAVYFIQEGAVDILRTVGDSTTHLRTLGAGEVLGEMGILRDAPRSTTAVAGKDSVLTRLSKKDFFDALRHANAIALPLLRMLCERLDTMNKRRLLLQPYGEGTPVKDVGNILLRPATEALAKVVGQDAVPVERLPFTVAAAPSGGSGKLDTRQMILSLPSDLPGAAELAEGCHFTIAKRKNYLMLQDFGAAAGTYANDEFLDRFHHAGTAGLAPGRTTVRIGPENSAVQFHVDVS